jgi:hypothetical protein
VIRRAKNTPAILECQVLFLIFSKKSFNSRNFLQINASRLPSYLARKAKARKAGKLQSFSTIRAFV